MENKKLDLLVKSLKTYDPEKIILFGSAARASKRAGKPAPTRRGDLGRPDESRPSKRGWDEYSDIDLIVVKKTTKRFLERLKEVALLCPDEVNADIFVYTPEEFALMKDQENPFVEKALKEGIVLYEKPSRGSTTLVETGRTQP